MIAEYYSIKSEDFKKYSKFEFKIVKSLKDLYIEFAKDFANLINKNNSEKKETTVILPVGPFDYRVVTNFFNEKKVNCKNTVIFMMDEYCTDDGKIIPYEHPLSFHRFIYENFFFLLKEDLRMPQENIIFPNPENPEYTTKRIEEINGVDVCYGGFGINGHFAFNEPPEPNEKVDENSVRNSVTRIVNLTRETRTALALGSTFGNWDLIPSKAVTLGMKELLLSKEIHLYFMRTWHAGVMRKALFGSIAPNFPASYIQTHPHVKVVMTSYVAKLPEINVTQATGLK
jgi:glucosamine-6-phosphate deaminase